MLGCDASEWWDGWMTVAMSSSTFEEEGLARFNERVARRSHFCSLTTTKLCFSSSPPSRISNGTRSFSPPQIVRAILFSALPGNPSKSDVASITHRHVWETKCPPRLDPSLSQLLDQPDSFLQQPTTRRDHVCHCLLAPHAPLGPYEGDYPIQPDIDTDTRTLDTLPSSPAAADVKEPTRLSSAAGDGADPHLGFVPLFFPLCIFDRFWPFFLEAAGGAAADVSDGVDPGPLGTKPGGAEASLVYYSSIVILSIYENDVTIGDARFATFYRGLCPLRQA